MEEILVLVDYKSSFGSKYNATPPYSGLDLGTFTIEMKKYGYLITAKHFYEVDFTAPDSYTDVKILYQSSEANDSYGEYKSHIDDVLYYLQLAGAQLIPDYKFFKAHSNKVFMEMLRAFFPHNNKPKNNVYGSLEDFKLHSVEKNFPLVIKKSHGALSEGVFKADNEKQLIKIVKKISTASFTLKEVFKERLREIKYKHYKRFSIHRSKFIVQSFSKGLNEDFKIVIFHDIAFVVKRKNRPNDFRASGGGYNSYTGEFKLPEGLLDYSYHLYEKFNCPYISMDIGINESGFNLIEFQFVSFGTLPHCKSKYYFERIDSKYLIKENNLSIEYLYSHSLNAFFNR